MATSFASRAQGRRAGLLLLLLAVLVGGLTEVQAGTPGRERVRLQLKWRHQFQFAGYYAALHQGFYRDAGLEVDIREATEGINPVDSVLKGQSDFGIYGTELLRYRATGVPVVAVAAIFQHSPAVIVCRQDRGIRQAADLAGKRLYMEPDAADLLAFLKIKGIDTNRFTNPFSASAHDFTVDSLIQGRVDGMYVYVTDELFALRQANLDCVVFSPRDEGIDFYADILFTTEKTVAENPRLVRAFREATLKGWEYAMAHKTEIVQLILSQYTTRHSREHLQFEADQMQPLLETEVVEIGYMSQPRWQAIAGAYRRLGMLSGDVDLDRFIYAPGRQPKVIRYWKETVLAALVAGMALLLSLRYFKLARSFKRENRQRQATEAALRKEVDEHKRARESVAELANLGMRLSAVPTAKEAAEIIMEVADRLFGWDACKLDLYSREKNQIYQVLIKDTIDGKRVEFPPPYEHPQPSPLTQQVIDQGARLILRETQVPLPGAIPFGDRARPSASLMFVPIRHGASVRGVATIQSYSPNAYTQEDLHAFQALADHCGGALERLRVQEERERLIQQLQTALAQVKTLSGLLPICASCKKIRDDQGYWNQVEIYIRDRSDAHFTHSICPECVQKLYPDIYPGKP